MLVIITQLLTQKKSFTKGQRRLADYMQEHLTEAAFLTSSKMAEKTQVSEATVIRFARLLGYSGYVELKEALQTEIRKKITPNIKLKATVQELKGEEDLFSTLLQMDGAMLQEIEACTKEQIREAVTLIAKVDTIYLMGLGVSKAIVAFLEFRLNRMGRKVVTITAGGTDVIDHLRNINQNDVFVGIGFSHLHRELLIGFDLAMEKKAQCIAFTDSDSPLLAKNLQILIKARGGPVETMTSLVVPMALANILVLTLAMKDEKAAIDAFADFHHLKEKYHL